jgi:hypothetical protein
LPVFFIRKTPLSGGYCLYRTNACAGAAVLTFGGIYPAVTVFFGYSLNRTFTVAGTAINAFIVYFVGHDLPLSGNFDTIRI